MAKIQKITPCLWFNGNADEAVKFYSSVFKDARTISTSKYGKGAPLPEGTLLTVDFELAGQRFVALNAGPEFKFNEAISLTVYCDTQAEIDYFWDKLMAGGGKPVECGWLRDKYGLSWQVVPSKLPEMIAANGPNGGEAASRVFTAIMSTVKFDIATLEKAAAGK